MSKILVIADDLTGAAEIASLAYNHGPSVAVRMMEGLNEDFDEDILVVNTDTRNLSKENVSHQINKVLRRFKPNKNLLVYKKTDSLLRGWIETEIRTVLSATKSSFAILIPANPSKNRLIIKGKYFINGQTIEQTEFSVDPEYPRKHSEIIDLIQDRSEMTVVGNIDWNDTQGKIVLPDISSVDDIRSIINTRISSKTLCCGSAAFFQELLPFWCRQKTIGLPSEIKVSTPRVFLMGSRSAANRNAKNILRAQAYQFYSLTLQMLNEEKKFHEWKSEIVEQPVSPMGCILSCPEERIEDVAKVELITEKLVDIGIELAGLDKASIHFFITGGKTASLFCKRLDWHSFFIHSVRGDGIVTLSVKNSKHLLTIKPGSYAWPNEVLKIEQ